MLPPADVAQKHADSRLVLVNAAGLAAADAWAKVDPGDIVTSWTAQVPELLAVTSGAQLAAAADADEYLDDVVESQDLPPEPSPRIDPHAFVGGSSGMQLVTMLIQPVFTTLMAIAAKSSPREALRVGGQQLDTTVRTQVADAGRTADGVSLAAHPGVDGYIRVVVGKTCSRCLLLAGKKYRWNAGFDRHPRCDCVHMPCLLADHLQVVQDPKAIYRSLSDRERSAAGWSHADQKAIADGADLAQITNADRGVYTAGGQKLTREGTTKSGLASKRLGAGKSRAARLTPEQIYLDAGDDRDLALQLLYRNGYLANEPAALKRGELTLAASRSSGISPAKAASAAGPPIRRVLEIQRTTDDVAVAFEYEAKRITGREIKADFSGASPATAREHAEGVLRGLERFPDAKLRRIDHFDRAEETYAEAGGGQIGFNLRFADVAGRRRYLTALQGDVAGWEKNNPYIHGWHVRGSNSPAAIAVHEFGHIIDIDNLGDAIHGEVENLVRAMAERENIRPDLLIGRQISKYAQTDSHELVAEAFTDVLINGDRASELSRGIMDILEGEYRRSGGVVRKPDLALAASTAKAVSRAAGLAGKTVPQLRALAKEQGIKIPARALKADIIRLLEAESPTTPVAGAAKRAAARARQLEIDRRGGVSELLAEFDELLSKEAAKEVFAQRLDLAAATGIDEATIAALRRTIGDTTKTRAAITRLGKKEGITPIGKAGQKVAFDENLHDPFGDLPTPGEQVLVVRRGTTVTIGNETIPLTKAQVAPLPAKPVKVKQAAKSTKAAPKPKVATQKPDPFAGAIYRDPTNVSPASMAEARDLARRYERRDLDPSRWDPFDDSDRLDELRSEIGEPAFRRVMQEAQIDQRFVGFRANNPSPLSDEDYRADLARRAREAMAGSIAVRVSPTGLGRILEQGRFKTQFETGKSAALNDAERRARYEAQAFGLPEVGTDPTVRPVYGYVMVDGRRAAGGAADLLSQYGQVQVVLRDTVRTRTTGMVGDSMDFSQVGLPGPIDNPDWRAFNVSTGGASARAVVGIERDYGSALWRENTYIEAQVHGGVTVDDIAEVILPKEPSVQQRKALQAAGIPWTVLAAS